MLYQKIKEERERLGMTQVALARSAGVPRSQLAVFEGGGNVTLATLEKILTEISTLRLDVFPATLDIDAARRTAEELQALAAQMHAAAGRLVTALGGTPAPPETLAKPATPERPLRGGGGAELYDEDATQITPELAAHLERLVAEIKKNKGRKAKDHG